MRSNFCVFPLSMKALVASVFVICYRWHFIQDGIESGVCAKTGNGVSNVGWKLFSLRRNFSVQGRDQASQSQATPHVLFPSHNVTYSKG